MLILDLNDLARGKLDREAFTERLSGVEWSSYDGQDVGIKGCAPTWAHLLVAARLFKRVRSLSFLMDDGKGSVPIEVFNSGA